MLRKIVDSDYRSLSFEAFSEMVAPEGAGRLDETEVYGVQWYNRGKAPTRTASEPDDSDRTGEGLWAAAPGLEEELRQPLRKIF